jgi:hypothetical protein
VTLDAAALADGAWVAAVFEPLPASAGRDLYVWATSDGADGSAVTLWTYTRGHGDRPPDGLHLDHAPAAGSLAFRTYYAPQ